jgi:cytochrome b
LPPANPPGVRVWGIAVRLLHWTLAAAVATAWFAAERHPTLHQTAGYVALAAVALRLLLGVTGSGHARFDRFMRGPRATLRYAAAVWRRREPRHLGHNPLGGWMAVALLACVLAVAATGWLYTTLDYWGDPRVEALHRRLAWTLIALTAAHLAGVVHTSVRHRENLVAAMFSGRKRVPGADDVA